MTTNKNLLTQIEETLARNNANVSANLINIAQIFAQLDERFAAIEIKRPACGSTEAALASGVWRAGEMG